jgi:hypothetical protein
VTALQMMDRAWYRWGIPRESHYRGLAVELADLSTEELIALPALLEHLVLSVPRAQQRTWGEVFDLVKVTTAPAHTGQPPLALTTTGTYRHASAGARL